MSEKLNSGFDINLSIKDGNLPEYVRTSGELEKTEESEVIGLSQDIKKIEELAGSMSHYIEKKIKYEAVGSSPDIEKREESKAISIAEEKSEESYSHDREKIKSFESVGASLDLEKKEKSEVVSTAQEKTEELEAFSICEEIINQTGALEAISTIETSEDSLSVGSINIRVSEPFSLSEHPELYLDEIDNEEGTRSVVDEMRESPLNNKILSQEVLPKHIKKEEISVDLYPILIEEFDQGTLDANLNKLDTSEGKRTPIKPCSVLTDNVECKHKSPGKPNVNIVTDQEGYIHQPKRRGRPPKRRKNLLCKDIASKNEFGSPFAKTVPDESSSGKIVTKEVSSGHDFSRKSLDIHTPEDMTNQTLAKLMSASYIEAQQSSNDKGDILTSNNTSKASSVEKSDKELANQNIHNFHKIRKSTGPKKIMKSDMQLEESSVESCTTEEVGTVLTDEETKSNEINTSSNNSVNEDCKNKMEKPTNKSHGVTVLTPRELIDRTLEKLATRRYPCQPKDYHRTLAEKNNSKSSMSEINLKNNSMSEEEILEKNKKDEMQQNLVRLTLTKFTQEKSSKPKPIISNKIEVVDISEQPNVKKGEKKLHIKPTLSVRVAIPRESKLKAKIYTPPEQKQKPKNDIKSNISSKMSIVMESEKKKNVPRTPTVYEEILSKVKNNREMSTEESHMEGRNVVIGNKSILSQNKKRTAMNKSDSKSCLTVSGSMHTDLKLELGQLKSRQTMKRKKYRGKNRLFSVMKKRNQLNVKKIKNNSLLNENCKSNAQVGNQSNESISSKSDMTNRGSNLMCVKNSISEPTTPEKVPQGKCNNSLQKSLEDKLKMEARMANPSVLLVDCKKFEVCASILIKEDVHKKRGQEKSEQELKGVMCISNTSDDKHNQSDDNHLSDDDNNYLSDDNHCQSDDNHLTVNSNEYFAQLELSPSSVKQVDSVDSIGLNTNTLESIGRKENVSEKESFNNILGDNTHNKRDGKTSPKKQESPVKKIKLFPNSNSSPREKRSPYKTIQRSFVLPIQFPSKLQTDTNVNSVLQYPTSSLAQSQCALEAHNSLIPKLVQGNINTTTNTEKPEETLQTVSSKQTEQSKPSPNLTKQYSISTESLSNDATLLNKVVMAGTPAEIAQGDPRYKCIPRKPSVFLLNQPVILPPIFPISATVNTHKITSALSTAKKYKFHPLFTVEGDKIVPMKALNYLTENNSSKVQSKTNQKSSNAKFSEKFPSSLPCQSLKSVHSTKIVVDSKSLKEFPVAVSTPLALPIARPLLNLSSTHPSSCSTSRNIKQSSGSFTVSTSQPENKNSVLQTKRIEQVIYYSPFTNTNIDTDNPTGPKRRKYQNHCEKSYISSYRNKTESPEPPMECKINSDKDSTVILNAPEPVSHAEVATSSVICPSFDYGDSTPPKRRKLADQQKTNYMLDKPSGEMAEVMISDCCENNPPGNNSIGLSDNQSQSGEEMIVSILQNQNIKLDGLQDEKKQLERKRENISTLGDNNNGTRELITFPISQTNRKKQSDNEIKENKLVKSEQDILKGKRKLLKNSEGKLNTTCNIENTTQEKMCVSLSENRNKHITSLEKNIGKKKKKRVKSKEEELEEALDGVPPFIREVFKCENIRYGFDTRDLIFVLSLLPDIEEMTTSQRVIFQLRAIEIINDVFNSPRIKTDLKTTET